MKPLYCKPFVEQLEDRLTPTAAWYAGPAGVPASVYVPGPTVPDVVYIETQPGTHYYQALPTIPAPVSAGTLTVTVAVTPGADGPTLELHAATDVNLSGVVFRVRYDPSQVAVASILGQPTKDLMGVQDQQWAVGVLVAYAHVQPGEYWMTAGQQQSLGVIRFAGSNDAVFSIEAVDLPPWVSFASSLTLQQPQASV